MRSMSNPASPPGAPVRDAGPTLGQRPETPAQRFSRPTLGRSGRPPTMHSEPAQPVAETTDPSAAIDRNAAGNPAAAAEVPDTADLIEQLRQDRLWLLRQIDSGQWGEWRLDLAALERELGQLLEQANERLIGS